MTGHPVHPEWQVVHNLWQFQDPAFSRHDRFYICRAMQLSHRVLVQVDHDYKRPTKPAFMEIRPGLIA